MSVEIEVAVPTPLPQTFTYLGEAAIAPGYRVLVPFGPRRVVGVVVPTRVAPTVSPSSRDYQIKSVLEVIDSEPAFSPVLLRLADWLSQYYLTPIGEVFRAMLPGGTERVRRHALILAAKGERLIQKEPESGLAMVLRKVFPDTRPVIKATAEQRLRRARTALAPGVDENMFNINKLLSDGFCSASSATHQRARTVRGDAPSAKTDPDWGQTPSEHQLSAVQEAVLNSILTDAEPERPTLLHGVTGSGKTELYMRVIERTEGQVLILVPEISLTPQTTRVFARRFPGSLAVVHSGLAPNVRWDETQRVRTGAARILIGPRSAVFSPFKNLRLIIVDEEHDSSYKQTTGLPYHGRDVAVMRAHMEKARVILGSATPSLESFHNAQRGRYRLATLSERVHGRPMPAVSLIETQLPSRHATLATQTPNLVETEVPIAGQIIDALRQNIEAKHQSMVIVNRRGYALFLMDVVQRQTVTCPDCSISLTLHQRNEMLRCHYCEYSIAVQAYMSQYPDRTFAAVGYGSERAEVALVRQLPNARIARLDSDTVAHPETLNRVLQEFRSGDIDILVGTQILAKGHDFPKVTLLCLLDLDYLLDFPDFRSGERTFQLLVQSAGRAGRDQLPGRVLVQSLRPRHPVVVTAIGQDYLGFARAELALRQAHSFPPFSRMVSIEMASTSSEALHSLERRIDPWLDQFAAVNRDLLARITVRGPSIPPIAKVRRHYRRVLYVSGASPTDLHTFVRAFLAAFDRRSTRVVQIRVDVDPQSLM